MTNTTPSAQPPATFKGDLLRLVSGAGVAQAILLLAAPILTRLYDPQTFGIAALFASLSAMVGVVACLRYELSIILPDNDREAANLLAISLVLACMMAAACASLLWWGGAHALSWFEIPELLPYLWVFPLAVLFQGVTMALNYWAIRTRRFTRLALARVGSALGNAATGVGAGLGGHATSGALIGAGVGGQAIGVALLAAPMWRADGRFLRQNLGWREMLAGLARHRRFPIFSTWAALLNTASWQLPVLLFAALFSPYLAGLYALGMRMIQLPMNVIGGAVSQVFIQRAAAARAPAELSRLTESLFAALLCVAWLPSLVLMAVGDVLFTLVFGERWTEAGRIVQVLAPWALLWFIASPLSSVYVVLEKQKSEIKIQALIFFTRCLAIAVGGYFGAPTLAIALFTLAGIIAYGYLITVILGWCNLRWIDIARRNGVLVAVGLLYAAPLLAMRACGAADTVLLVGATLTLVVYGAAHRTTLARLLSA